jgi:hypothetical protein
MNTLESQLFSQEFSLFFVGLGFSMTFKECDRTGMN